MVNRLANVLKDHGVKKGDVVCIYMPVSPLAVAAMLACARIGAPHRSVLLKVARLDFLGLIPPNFEH